MARGTERVRAVGSRSIRFISVDEEVHHALLGESISACTVDCDLIFGAYDTVRTDTESHGGSVLPGREGWGEQGRSQLERHGANLGLIGRCRSRQWMLLPSTM